MEALDQSFAARFGAPPAASAQIPGRVNLLGEHTDYNGGRVLPTGLPQGVSVSLARNGTGEDRIHAARYDETITRSIADSANGHWSDYALGALSLARTNGWIEGGCDLLITSNLKEGSGLSSSAALITAVLKASASAARATPDPITLAKAARAVENDFIGMPCGIMDQMAVALAGPGTALHLDTTTLAYDRIDIPPGWRFAVIHSGVTRKLSDGRYGDRFEECARAAEALGVPALCTMSDADLAHAQTLPAPLAARVRHVVSDHNRANQGAEALRAGDLAGFGALMSESHRSYAQDFDASVPEIDALVSDTLHLGALGARLTGGGFGGCIVALLATDMPTDWFTRLKSAHPAITLIASGTPDQSTP